MQRDNLHVYLHDFTLINSPSIGLDNYFEGMFIFDDTISDPNEIQYQGHLLILGYNI